jgi:hypothetical protein
MVLTTMRLAVIALVMASTPAMALDCARVRELDQDGTRASDIARTLGITTPEVQACLAGVVEEPVMANPAGWLPLSPQRPTNDAPIRRGPDGQRD